MKGSEYAAAAAVEFHDLSCVILKIPSWFYSEGMYKVDRGSMVNALSCA